MRSRRSLLAATLGTLLIGACLGTPQLASASSPDDRVAGSYIVDLKPGTSAGRYAKKMAEQYGGKARFIYDHVVGGFAFRGSAEAAAKLAKDGRVDSVEQDRVARLVDTPQTSLHHLSRDRVGAAWNAGFRGLGARIAILDTGVDKAHPVFADHHNVADGKGCGGGAGETEDFNGHGTASASNAAGRIGVGHSATIIPVKVFPGSSGEASWSTVICGLNWVDEYNDNHSAGSDIHIVSLSLAGVGIQALKDAVARVVNDGIFVVAAAGNAGGSSPQSPANYQGVIAASALGSGNNIASFSNKGGSLTAPGLDIYSANDGGGYLDRTGTSRSAPQIAGAAAIVFAEDFTLKAGEVREILRRSGKCPNNKTSGEAGYCHHKGQWSNDDGNTEPRIDAFCAGYLAANGVLHPTKCQLS